MSPMSPMNPMSPMLRRGALAMAATGVLLAMSGCVLTIGSGVQPETTVACPGQTVEVTLKNTDAVAHRYTVTVAVRHDDMTEDVLLSSEAVPAGGTVRLTETIQTEEPIGCTLEGVQTFAG